MGLLRWFSKNWANTTEPTHADLRTLELPGPVTDAVARVKTAGGTLRGWVLEAETADTLHFVRRTRLFRFADDIRVTVRENGGVARVDAESRSRLGKGDFGQNRRNIRELWATVGDVTSAGRRG
jgi:uncharacterized protein (DUF1499 family)